MSKESVCQIMDRNRLEELRAICRFIATCDFNELGVIVEEIRCVHDNLYAFNFETKLFCKVDSICISGESIQLNLEENMRNSCD